ncbi:MAG: hypothetical protein JF570_12300, partial [Caulobacter sp.]|nr:hypothetical protein [Caulobacter sp.]
RSTGVCADVLIRAARDAWRAELDNRIRTLSQLRNQLDDCIGCGCLSLKACPLRNPQDVLAAEGVGPRLLEPDVD